MADNITVHVNELGLRGPAGADGADGTDGMMAAASEAELDAGADDTVAVTPAGLTYFGFDKSTDITGYSALWQLDGSTVLAVTEEGAVEIPLLTTIDLAANTFSANEAAAKRSAIRDGAGDEVAATENVGSEEGEAAVDADGRAYRLWTPGDGFRAPMATVLRGHRSRRAGTATHAVISRRRGTGDNFDLFAIDLDTGDVTQLTSDADDHYDFADPAIVGSDCWLTRYAGDTATDLAIPLAGPTNGFRRQEPVRQIAFYGDSFVSANAMAGLLSILNAASPFRWIEQIAPGVGIRGFGGRSLTGTSYALLGGTTGGSDSPPSTVYPGVPADQDSLLVITDNMALNGGEADMAAWVARMTATVNALRTSHKRFIIIEPGLDLNAVSGSVTRTAWEARWANVTAAFPDNIAPVLEYMQDHGDGGATDNSFIAADLWPASCLLDPGTPTAGNDWHPSSPKGQTLYGEAAALRIIEKGWHL